MNGRTFICLLALLPLGALADGTVHRWVDERGVVNYGDKPPPDRKATPVPITDPLTVSRPPAPTTPPETAAPPARAGTQPMDRDAVRQEIESTLRREQAARRRRRNAIRKRREQKRAGAARNSAASTAIRRSRTICTSRRPASCAGTTRYRRSSRPAPPTHPRRRC